MWEKLYPLAVRIRTYGISGCLSFASTYFKRRAKYNFFRANIAQYPCSKPTKGLTIIGPFSSQHSLSKVLRDFALSLKDSGIPFQTYNTSTDKETVSAEDLSDILTNKKDFRLLKYTHIIDLFTDPFLFDVPRIRYRIAFWEFESGLVEAYPRLLDHVNIIAFSDFNAKVFSSLLPSYLNVQKVLYPFRQVPVAPAKASYIRSKHGLGENDFVVFFNFDLGSSVNRKNPTAAIKAFALAFHNAKNAKLVFKTMHAKQYANALAQLRNFASELGLSERLIIITEYLALSDLYGLTAACDVYLSLHRGEGFGLGIAEAMSLGKPVVITDYSGPTEFCNYANARPIPFQRTPISTGQHDHPSYKFISSWVEPDINAAAAVLRELYMNPQKRKDIGHAAQAFIAQHFSIAKFKKSIEAFL